MTTNCKDATNDQLRGMCKEMLVRGRTKLDRDAMIERCCEPYQCEQNKRNLYRMCQSLRGRWSPNHCAVRDVFHPERKIGFGEKDVELTLSSRCEPRFKNEKNNLMIVALVQRSRKNPPDVSFTSFGNPTVTEEAFDRIMENVPHIPPDDIAEAIGIGKRARVKKNTNAVRGPDRIGDDTYYDAVTYYDGRFPLVLSDRSREYWEERLGGAVESLMEIFELT